MIVVVRPRPSMQIPSDKAGTFGRYARNGSGLRILRFAQNDNVVQSSLRNDGGLPILRYA